MIAGVCLGEDGNEKPEVNKLGKRAQKALYIFALLFIYIADMQCEA
jgi:hypothetical protein